MQKKQESMIGNVKCLGSHPTNSDFVLSGSRDGSFAIWDLRCKSISKSRCDEVCHPSTSMVKGAHLSSQARRGRRGKAAVAGVPFVDVLTTAYNFRVGGIFFPLTKFDFPFFLNLKQKQIFYDANNAFPSL
ncbi:hypothetical protein PVK06_017886 [Gossypium arboreum]|uniref:Uncharacterized protein n=1 Tax=Gossypium arboreum TaxID=29729 RepID=A0ABR0Q4Q0_GOSAR|nr:hypothetical protein PVK06_017886 [Gossypium arboreum]